MVRRLDIEVITDGIRVSELSKYIENIIAQNSRKCDTSYLKITIEGGSESGLLKVVVLVSRNRVVGEQIEGKLSDIDKTIFTIARVECLSPAEFAYELSKATRPSLVMPRRTGYGGERLVTRESDILKYLRDYLDARLGMKLVNDPFWYTRLLMKANLVYEEHNGDLEKLLETIKDVMKSYKAALITLTGGGRELRVYVSGSRVGIGYIEGSITEVGLEALRRASDVKGSIKVYTIKSRLPTLTI